MTRARKALIDLSSTSYYHLIARCVRRAFLCGEDKYTGKNFDHRRTWLVERVKLLSRVFAIDIAAYAIMSNHYHLVVKVNRQQALSWSDNEVISRWYKLYKGSPIMDKQRNGGTLSEAEQLLVSELIEKWRARLYDISWFMKNLNEYIAKEANKEDGCTGKYWEGRYKSQALLDETALLSCMAYVDLNPIRANMADNLEDSGFTSIQERIRHFKNAKPNAQKSNQNNENAHQIKQPKSLKSFGTREYENTIPFSLLDYLELVDWTGRHVHPNKKGFIPKNVPDILVSLRIEEVTWLDRVQNYGTHYGNFAGSKTVLRAQAAKNDVSWYKGVG
ncbi:transposase [Pseudoalteromonas luteoviolacea]|uniref:transposase n=1 Tax=Pseudoalteromonas luteoviolacea TaxID=43657 RepID=UPI001F27D90E|nr:transposase [Pseudoalteromonas luteoviolacea]MCF6443080.1 transposase [Pseudoalteromonas luteoviolacea]